MPGPPRGLQPGALCTAPECPCSSRAHTSGPVLDVHPAVSSETPPFVRFSRAHL